MDSKCFIAVRKTDGREWIDMNSWNFVAQAAQDHADKTNKQIPVWAKDNPVVRIARFKIYEMRT